MRTEEGAAGREEAAIVFVVDDDASICEAIGDCWPRSG